MEENRNKKHNEQITRTYPIMLLMILCCDIFVPSIDICNRRIGIKPKQQLNWVIIE